MGMGCDVRFSFGMHILRVLWCRNLWVDFRDIVGDVAIDSVRMM
jgi:hypothetical protein